MGLISRVSSRTYRGCAIMTTVILDGLSRNARTNDVEEFFHGFGRIRDINIKAEHALITFDDRRDADDAVKRLDGRRLCDERVRVMFESRNDEPPRRDDYRRDDRRDNYRDNYNDRGYDRGGFNRGYDRGGFNDRRGGGGGYGDRFRDRSPRRDFGGRGGGRDFGGRPQKRRVERTKFGIITRNLSGRVTWMDLKDLGRKYGDITYSDANRIGDREGLITYATRKDMINAFESLKGLEFMGRELEVEYEFPETADEDWNGETNNDHPNSDKKENGGRDGGRDGSRGNSRDRSRSASNDRFRDRSRSRSYSRWSDEKLIEPGQNCS